MIMEFSSNSSIAPTKYWWIAIVSAILVLILSNYLFDISIKYTVSLLFIMALLALSMGFLWGYVGLLSFGQTVFFGIGGYAYAIFSISYEGSIFALLAGVIAAVLFAAIMGYFIIYGKISDIYFSIMTMVVTLVLEKAMRATSGEQFRVLGVPLNGQNGIPGVPAIVLPWHEQPLSIEQTYFLCGLVLIAVYVGLRMTLTSAFGRALVGVRENERRMALLGYNVEFLKFNGFLLSAGVAGLAGGLFAAWGSYISPEVFSLNQAAQIVTWVIVGGKSTLIGPIVGTGLMLYLSNWLGSIGVGQVTIFQGAVLICVAVFFARGLLPTLGDAVARGMRGGIASRRRRGEGS